MKTSTKQTKQRQVESRDAYFEGRHPSPFALRLSLFAPRSATAFTLVELLTVVGILGILLAVVFPVLWLLEGLGNRAAGINTVNVAVSAARAFAPRNIGALSSVGPQAEYSGVALLFTPSGELRLVEDTQSGISTAGPYLEEMTPSRNGFTDLPAMDYISMPKGAGVVGISRGGTGATGLYLFTPPFAIRFDEQGSLIAGHAADGQEPLVFYDANYDGLYRTNAGDGLNRADPYGATTPYNPDEWDPQSSSYDSTNFDTVSGRHKLPFEEIETVMGVILFSKIELQAAGHSLASEGTAATTVKLNPAATTWVLENGKPLLFGRLTGKIMRD